MTVCFLLWQSYQHFEGDILFLKGYVSTLKTLAKLQLSSPYTQPSSFVAVLKCSLHLWCCHDAQLVNALGIKPNMTWVTPKTHTVLESRLIQAVPYFYADSVTPTHIHMQTDRQCNKTVVFLSTHYSFPSLFRSDKHIIVRILCASSWIISGNINFRSYHF